jgi:hypothetical protein
MAHTVQILYKNLQTLGKKTEEDYTVETAIRFQTYGEADTDMKTDYNKTQHQPHTINVTVEKQIVVQEPQTSVY